MRPEDFDKLLAAKEGQNTEFKASLTSERQEETIQSLVAFANRDGGRVCLGVDNDGNIVGVQAGKDTIEKIANKLSSQTYPTLPVFIEIQSVDDKEVVVIEGPADSPPLVGAYLYSPRPIDPLSITDATQMVVYRRVGSTNQKVDLMQLRRPLASDPNVIIYLNGAGSSAGELFPRKVDFYYTNSGNGWAFDVSFQAYHPSLTIEIGPSGISLPPWDQEDPHFKAHRRKGTLTVTSQAVESALRETVKLTASYREEHGLTWNSVLELMSSQCEGASQPLFEFKPGSFYRRIVSLPPKSR
jgi:Putative DNA-binding domain